MRPAAPSPRPQRIAIIGSGISGLAAAWLLSGSHDVTVYEKSDHVGGHSNTVLAALPGGEIPVDTGFIVFNERNYPNLTALFRELKVAVAPSDMSFAVSAGNGRLEYGSAVPGMLFAQRRNLLRPRFWAMLRDIRRFHRDATAALADLRTGETLGQFLDRHGYGRDMIAHHVLPMGAAIWSTPPARMLDYPVASLFRFLDNHGLLGLDNRPAWSTVRGGSREYVRRMTAGFRRPVRVDSAVEAVTRLPNDVRIEDRQGGVEHYDAVIMACHADQSLQLLKDVDEAERRVLGAFGFQRNIAVLHTDPGLMPRRRAAWASWNVLVQDPEQICVTYWMNRLQPLPTATNLFVTLNPVSMPREGTILRSFLYEHPVFDTRAVRMQSLAWNIQGQRRTWFCGAWLGHGFHEDGLQAGLAVAEALGGVQRPWTVENPSGRISLPAGWPGVLDTRVRAA